MRKLIAGMKMSADGKVEGAEGSADWVAAWSEDYGLVRQIDACVLGGGMYPGYEQYWSAIQNDPDKPVWITGEAPTPADRKWARFAAKTPHYVLSSTLTSALWPRTSFVRGVKGGCRPQAANRQGYLSRWGGSNDGEPHRSRTGG